VNLTIFDCLVEKEASKKVKQFSKFNQKLSKVGNEWYDAQHCTIVPLFSITNMAS